MRRDASFAQDGSGTTAARGPVALQDDPRLQTDLMMCAHEVEIPPLVFWLKLVPKVQFQPVLDGPRSGSLRRAREARVYTDQRFSHSQDIL